MDKRIFPIFLLMVWPLLTMAQGVSIYTTSRETGIAYAPIGDTGIWVTSWRAGNNPNNNRSYPVPIGFSFNYLGYSFSEVSVSTNGFIDFSTNPAAGDLDKPYGFDNNAFSLPSPNGTLLAIAPFYDDLMVTWEYSLTSSIKYVTSGVSGNRIFTLEWVHFSIDQSNTDHVNFQVKLYEADSKIEFIYGSMNAALITPSYTCGINASLLSVPPNAAQLLTQQFANSSNFGSTPKNNLSAIPESNSKITFTGCLLPGAAGPIDGPNHVCLPANGLFFSIPPIPSATGYIWTLPAGFTIVSGNNSFFITVNAGSNANPGNITVSGINTCGTGIAATKPITVSTRPTPTITGPATACAGTIEYSFTTQPSMSNYQWTVSPTGTITSGLGTNTITVVWPASSIDTVRVNYNDINGCPAFSPGSHPVTVYPATTPVITGPDQVCINSQGNMYTTEPGMSGYIWTVPSGGTITGGGTTNSNTVTVTWNTAGAQSVSVSYTNPNGCASQTPTSYPVTVNSLPVPSITGPQAACIGSTGNVYSTQPGMSNYIWQVSSGGTITSGGTTTSSSVTITWNTSGSNTVSVNYTTPSGCSALEPTLFNLMVSPRPTPTITGPANACPGSANNVYTTESGMSNYIWSISPGGIITAGGSSTSNIAIVTWNSPGGQTISVNYNNLHGCSALTATAYGVYVELLPIPLITGPDTVCENSMNNIYSTETGMSNYVWSVSTGGVITGGGTTTSPSVTVQWILPGPQSVGVNYTNATGCQTVSPGILDVVVDTLPIPTITGPDSVCVATSGNIFYTEPGMTGYDWTVSPGGEIINGAGSPLVEITWAYSGAQSVSVVYTDEQGCTPATPFLFNVEVLPRPLPTITGPEMTCVGTSGYIYTTEPGMTGYVWSISPGGAITGGSGTRAVTVAWNATGLQSISVEYTTLSGCASAAPTVKEVTVSPLPLPSVSGNTNPCVNSGSYSYTTEGGMNSYIWSIAPGGIIISGEETNTVLVSWIGAGAQWIMVNYTTPGGCTGTTPGNLNVVVYPVPGAAGTITGPGEVCTGSSGAPFSVDSVPNALNYVWNLPPGAVIATGSGTRNITVNFAVTATSGDITVFGYNACASGQPSPPLSLTVNALPSPAGPVTGLDTVARGATGIGYSVPVVEHATGYEWTIPPGSSITSGMNTNAILVDFSLAAGTGNLYVYGANPCGFGGSSPIFLVTVTDPPAAPVIFQIADSLFSNYSTGNQWYFNGDPVTGATGRAYHVTQSGWYWDVVFRYGVFSEPSNHIYVNVTGIDNRDDRQIHVYPVPNNGLFTLSVDKPSDSPYTLTIYDPIGLKVFELQEIPGRGAFEKKINLQPIPSGIYTLILRNDQIRYVKKIIVTGP